MDAYTINTDLRHGKLLSSEAINWMVQAIADGTVSDSQVGAFAMAVCIRGMDTKQRAVLTMAMRDSGEVLAWDVNGPVVDKHSTGGIGDVVSLILAPALAACGAYVPMISGRGLGHTGGTLDKLEAIPDFNVNLSIAGFQTAVKQSGLAIVAADKNMAPADRRLYSIRDVSGTVESIDLITASILSKKLAAGLEHLIMDVKVGSGAFFEKQEDAIALANSIVHTGTQAGCKVTAILSDMHQPLSTNIGNGLEVIDALRVLNDEKPGRLKDLTVALGGALLAQCHLAKDISQGEEAMQAALANGSAMEKFLAMVHSQTPKDSMARKASNLQQWQELLPKAAVVHEIKSAKSGYVSALDGKAIGQVIIDLGGGRRREGDKLDYAAGISDIVAHGSKVEQGDSLMVVHASSEEKAQFAIKNLLNAIKISHAKPNPLPLIKNRIMK